MKTLIFYISFLSFTHYSYSQASIIINHERCGIHGNAQASRAEYNSNVLKNRYSFPEPSDFDWGITLKELISAEDNDYNASTAVEICGYVYRIKRGGRETCNCKSGDSYDRDTHIEITINNKYTEPENRFIVEVTPRLRMLFDYQGIDWTTEGLKDKFEHKYVKIQGWLFYDLSHAEENYSDDPEDEDGRANWRSTSWEIHPITNIELARNPN